MIFLNWSYSAVGNSYTNVGLFKMTLFSVNFMVVSYINGRYLKAQTVQRLIAMSVQTQNHQSLRAVSILYGEKKYRSLYQSEYSNVVKPRLIDKFRDKIHSDIHTIEHSGILIDELMGQINRQLGRWTERFLAVHAYALQEMVPVEKK